MKLSTFAFQKDYVNRTPGVSYGTNMPPELMQNPYSRLPYSQQSMGMYTQNQPLPPGQHLIAETLKEAYYGSVYFLTL